jgi:hypothetical protein
MVTCVLEREPTSEESAVALPAHRRIVVLRHKRRPLNRHPEALGARLCAPSHRRSATADLRILNPTSGKPEVGG